MRGSAARWGCAAAVAILALGGACGDRCTRHSDCPSGEYCAPSATCAPAPDAPPPADATSIDAATDGPPIDAAPIDAAPIDAAPDGSVDAVAPVALDASPGGDA